MKKWRSFLIAFLTTGAAVYSWLALPLWRDVRFQTGFTGDAVVLPSGHRFKPGGWHRWPKDESPLSGADESGILRQEGRPEPVRIEKSSGTSYAARVTTSRSCGAAKTWFIVPAKERE